MARAWTCPIIGHGSFLQTTLDVLGPKAEISSEMTITGRAGERAHDRAVAAAAAGEKALRRYACPVCLALVAKTGVPHSGAWVRPATTIEAAQAA